jgi:hypothetical protein
MGLAADAVSRWFRQPASVVILVPSPSILRCLSNTRDQLRSAHDLTLVHDARSDEDATTPLPPRFVSCIALLGRPFITQERQESGRLPRTISTAHRRSGCSAAATRPIRATPVPQVRAQAQRTHAKGSVDRMDQIVGCPWALLLNQVNGPSHSDTDVHPMAATTSIAAKCLGRLTRWCRSASYGVLEHRCVTQDREVLRVIRVSQLSG